MIGILLVTHGALCAGIKDSVDMLLGETEGVKTVSLVIGQDINEFMTEVVSGIEAVDTGDGVLVMVDIAGGSPYNTVAQCMRNHNIECVTGLNMPMLVEALDSRTEMCLRELADACMDAATHGVVNVKKQLNFK